MTSAAATATRPPVRDAVPAPRPQTPDKGQTVDGRMALFHWSPHPRAQTYRLQISRSETFDALHADFTVRDTTVTELSGLLPIDGSTWYWRVRAEDAESDWSDSAQFIAGRSADDTTQADREAALSESTAPHADETPQAVTPEEVEVPFHTARTSGTWAFTVGLVMIVTFVITMFFIASAV